MVKKAKKRGVKPGTKRGKYKRVTTLVNKLKDKNTLDAFNEAFMSATEPLKYTPAQPLTLCGQLEDAILLFETRISNAIAKINSLM